MAKQTLTVQLMHSQAALAAAEARIVELEGTLVKARECYRELRDSVCQQPKTGPIPVISYWTDGHGQVWEKTRIGNQARSRPVTQ